MLLGGKQKARTLPPIGTRAASIYGFSQAPGALDAEEIRTYHQKGGRPSHETRSHDTPHESFISTASEPPLLLPLCFHPSEDSSSLSVGSKSITLLALGRDLSIYGVAVCDNAAMEPEGS